MTKVASASFQSGDKVLALWGGAWFPAEVKIQLDGHTYEIHYEGFSSSYDRCLKHNELKIRNEPQASTGDAEKEIETEKCKNASEEVIQQMVKPSVVKVEPEAEKPPILCGTKNQSTPEPSYSGEKVPSNAPQDSFPNLKDKGGSKVKKDGPTFPTPMSTNSSAPTSESFPMESQSTKLDMNIEEVARKRFSVVKQQKHNSLTRITDLDVAENTVTLSVGKKVEVYWDADDAWYPGVIHRVNRKGNTVAIQYDDGEYEPIVSRKLLRVRPRLTRNSLGASLPRGLPLHIAEDTGPSQVAKSAETCGKDAPPSSSDFPKDDVTGGHKNKKQVAALPPACLGCKKRKKACDRVKPHCGRCVTLGDSSCKYPAPHVNLGGAAVSRAKQQKAQRSEAMDAPKQNHAKESLNDNAQSHTVDTGANEKRRAKRLRSPGGRGRRRGGHQPLEGAEPAPFGPPGGRGGRGASKRGRFSWERAEERALQEALRQSMAALAEATAPSPAPATARLAAPPPLPEPTPPVAAGAGASAVAAASSDSEADSSCSSRDEPPRRKQRGRPRKVACSPPPASASASAAEGRPSGGADQARGGTGDCAAACAEDCTSSDDTNSSSDDADNWGEETKRQLKRFPLKHRIKLEKGQGASDHWVRRSVREPCQGQRETPRFKELIQQLRANSNRVAVLKLKDYLPSDATPKTIDAVLGALGENRSCQVLYLQNFNRGLGEPQLERLAQVLRRGLSVWSVNLGENWRPCAAAWERFAEALRYTHVTHLYISEKAISAGLKTKFRDIIRENRKKHDRHKSVDNLDVIERCTNCWWNPSNGRELQEALRRHGVRSSAAQRRAAPRVCSAPGEAPEEDGEEEEDEGQEEREGGEEREEGRGEEAWEEDHWNEERGKEGEKEQQQWQQRRKQEEVA